MLDSNVFAIPIRQIFLLCAPPSATGALLNRTALAQVREALVPPRHLTGAKLDALQIYQLLGLQMQLSIMAG